MAVTGPSASLGSNVGGINASAMQQIQISPSDTVDLTSKNIRQLYIVANGNLAMTLVNDSSVGPTIAVVAGQTFNVIPKFVNSATTAAVLGLA